MTATLLAAGLAALAVGLLAGGAQGGADPRAALSRAAPVGARGSGARRGLPRGIAGWLGRPAGLAGTTAAGGLLLAGPVAGLLAAAVALAARAGARERARATVARRDHQRAVEAVQALGAELRSGRTPGEALEVAGEVATGEVGTALRRAAQAASLGGEVPAALLSTDRCALLCSLAACWRVCSGTGSGLAAAVERLADGLAADADRQRALEAELAGPRASAGLLALLPIAGVALSAGLGADPLRVLLHTPVGSACLVAGASLDLVGLLWTRALVRRAATA